MADRAGLPDIQALLGRIHIPSHFQPGRAITVKSQLPKARTGFMDDYVTLQKQDSREPLEENLRLIRIARILSKGGPAISIAELTTEQKIMTFEEALAYVEKREAAKKAEKALLQDLEKEAKRVSQKHKQKKEITKTPLRCEENGCQDVKGEESLETLPREQLHKDPIEEALIRINEGGKVVLS